MSIHILDCTLRDGGYVNQWRFGREGISGIVRSLERAGIDLIECGFLRDEPWSPDRSVYRTPGDFARAIGEKTPGHMYVALAEMANYYPPELLGRRDENGPDAIRYSFWMRLLDDAVDYAGRIVDRGYRLCVQPTRVEQYSDDQFANMIRRFNPMKPYALYIVDTFGLLRKKDLIRYARIADETLDADARLGYHAHNNMQQAFANAVAFAELDLRHDKMLDASIFGMGRGAGNLNTELLADYLNDSHGAGYDIPPLIQAYDRWLAPIRRESPWGYSIPYFMAASMALNPNYPWYYENQTDLGAARIVEIMAEIQGDDKFLYSPDKARKYMESYLDEEATS